ncbi:suppressor of cytokine signaling 2 [Trematomus bernacchii]|uniref:Suppressor of cytokine signaling 2 n=1 Tax=Pagothenia borchgrevinki TaxID=8213 RepID=A0ABD2G3V0_PAGBO|nr:suppressor of cytokine signaling 2 [Trematomus bernacchii]XP_033992186.1 suppressor of cytokine signaling 2 [Trematomus bernacchii]
MTCQSSESTETIESDRHSDNSSRVVESDESRIASAMKDLRNTGWYWGGLTANEAKEILQETSEGTFLLRDSSQSDFLFTISAMTSAGPTNLRIEFKHGKFKLDSVLLVRPRLRTFDSVVHLVQHYITLSRSGDRAARSSSSTVNSSSSSSSVQLLLTRPAYTALPPLQHLCRLAINSRTPQVQDLPLPNRLKDYLRDYSYHV